MKPDQFREELESLAEKLGLTVRYENGDFKGGLCQVKEQTFIIIPKRFPIEKQIQLLALEIARYPLENIFVLPAIRKLLEENQPVAEPVEPSNSDQENIEDNKKEIDTTEITTS